MPKLKTIKAISKRIKVTGGKKKKKFLTTPAGQDHFRTRRSGSKKMGKRSYQNTAKADRRNVQRAVPYA